MEVFRKFQARISWHEQAADLDPAPAGELSQVHRLSLGSVIRTVRALQWNSAVPHIEG